ncbi:hypothetical protein ACQFX9_02405 [Aliinostoc sp. HNIBRCY26]|uniref:hypothetical protein n=1 Tax=Aliinostoc sp. HNIBRCY26 TaxID=3418997 RepID=UPI003D08DE30
MKSNNNPSAEQKVDINHGFAVAANYGQQTIIYQNEQSDIVWAEKQNFDKYKYPEFPNLLEKDKLIQIIKNERLLMIGGSHEDQLDITEYIAMVLVENINQTKSPQNSNTESPQNSNLYVWELTCDEKTRISNVEILKKKHKKDNEYNNAIFILCNLEPIHVNKDLQKIQNAAKNSDNYVIVSTNIPYDKWSLGQEIKKLFWEVPHENLYNPQELAEALIKGIDKNKLLDKDLESHIRQRVSEQLELKTFTSIGRCVNSLNSEKEPINKERIDKAIQDSKNSKTSLEKWYHYQLDAREQLLAIGISFFDGLFEDQFFAALEKLVSEVWQQRDPSLQALDYCDFTNLGNHHSFTDEAKDPFDLNKFKFVKQEPYATDIEIYNSKIKRSNERPTLFSVAWKSHRRQIITALPVIVKLVQDSVGTKYDNWELYGNSNRRKRLRETITETLSDLGSVSTSSTSAVQGALIQLSADEHNEVQNVAATAIARWYRYDVNNKEKSKLLREKFLGTLQCFYSIAIRKAQPDEDKKARDCVGATVALAVRYAAKTDYNYSPQLSEELCAWLKELAENKQPIVRNCFRDNTLIYVVQLYLRQLYDNGILKHMIQQHADLNMDIALSLAIAVGTDSSTVKEILDSCYKECTQEWSINRRITTQYHTLLRTVALTYGYIDYNKTSTPFRFNQAFRRLHRILVEEKEPFVCDFVVIAICLLATNNLPQMEEELETLVSEFSEDKHNEIIKTLTKIYRDKAKLPESESQDAFPLELLKKLFQVVALVYEAVQQDEEKGTLTVQNAFLRLFDILVEKEERFISNSQISLKNDNISISETVTIAIRILASKHFEQLQLGTLPPKLTDNKYRDILKKILTDIYLDQRANQAGGDEEIEIKGCHYRVWTRSTRPATPMEELVYSWIRSENTTYHEIAIQASVYFVDALKD